MAAYSKLPAHAMIERVLLRGAVLSAPRGSLGAVNGDQIRMGILNMMRTHGIKEGHRPGIECLFLESWHQKLHTCTAPDDIIICEAYVKFLETQDMGAFHHILHEGG